MSQEQRERLSKAHLGQKAWNAGKHFIHSGSFKKGHFDLVPTESRIKAGEKHVGELHHAWTVNPSYSAIHTWIKRTLGSPTQCEHCGNEFVSNRKIHWANKSGKYLRDISDWFRLCVKCHFIYDKHPFHV